MVTRIILVSLVLTLTMADCPTSVLPSTAAGIASIDPVCFGPMSYLLLKALPSSACRGFSAAQMAQMATQTPYDFCEGFSAECISLLSSTASLSQNCLRRMNPEAALGFSSDQLNQLQNVASLRASVLAKLTQAQCLGLDSRFVGLLGGDETVDQCGRLSNSCLSGIPSLESMSSTCFSRITSDSTRCAFLSGSQLSSLTPSAAGSLSSDCLAALNSTSPSVCQQVPWSLLGANCRGVTADCLAKSSLKGISSVCLASLSGTSCRGLNALNMGAVSGVISNDCLNNLTAAACAALSVPLADSFSQGQCAQLSASCVQSMPQGVFSQITLDCALGFPPSYWSQQVPLVNVITMSRHGFGALSGKVFADLVQKYGVSFVEAVSLPQLSLPAADAVAEFVVLAAESGFPVPAYTFSNVSFGTDATWLQLAWSTNGDALIAANVQQLDPVTISGMRPTQTVAGSVVHRFSLQQLENINCVVLKSWGTDLLQQVDTPEHLVWPRMQVADQFLIWDLNLVWVPLWKRNAAVVNSMSCMSIVAMPDNFWETFQTVVTLTEALARYHSWRIAGCPSSSSSEDTSSVPCSGWRREVDLLLPTTWGAQTTTAASSAAPTTTAGSGLLNHRNIEIAVGVSVGVVVIVIIIVVIVVVRRRRKLAHIEYTPLNSLAVAENVDLGAEW